MTRSKLLAVAFGTALMAPGVVLAHHGANLYDMTKTVKVTGTIAKARDDVIERTPNATKARMQ